MSQAYNFFSFFHINYYLKYIMFFLYIHLHWFQCLIKCRVNEKNLKIFAYSKGAIYIEIIIIFYTFNYSFVYHIIQLNKCNSIVFFNMYINMLGSQNRKKESKWQWLKDKERKKPAKMEQKKITGH